MTRIHQREESGNDTMKTKTYLPCALFLALFSGCGDGAGEASSTDAPSAAGSNATTTGSPVGSNATPSDPMTAASAPVIPANPTTGEPAQVTNPSPEAQGPTTDPTLPATEPTDPEPTQPATDPVDNTEPAPVVDPVATEPMDPAEPTDPATPVDGEPTETPDPVVPATPDDSDVVDVGADENFSFFVASYYHIRELSGSDDGFGGDLRYNGAATGLEGADAICQEMARRVSFGHRTWRAYLSTSTVNAIDRVGEGPWYDFTGALVAEDTAGLLVARGEGGFGGGGVGGGGAGAGGGGLGGGGCIEGDTDRPAGGAMDCGTYDELGLFHDGSTDQNNDGVNDDDHDTMTATLADGTYAGFSCDDWTSTTAEPEAQEGGGGGDLGGGMGGGFGGLGGGIMMGHSWPAGSGTHWSEAHAGHACAAGTNFIQDGAGDSATVGGGGGYGGFYCFAAD